MKIIRGIEKIKKFKKPVLAMGIFDGVHLGHKRILKYAVKAARKINGTAIALTFDPHPQGEERIHSLAHRLRLIAEAGLDVCVVISFNKVFSRMPADKFIRDILVEKIGVSLVCVGENFRFGNSAQGDIRLLKRLGGAYHYRVKDFKILKINKRSISSTFIRALIKKGKIEEARRLLGRPVSILGTVIKGSALGRIIGFPTANINPHHEVMPPEGIYAVEVNLGRKRRKGVCYIGNRPTLNLKKRSIHIEVYLFNFDRNIYGEYLEIEFIKRIRKDKKFPSLALLAKQIKKDAYLAQKILN